MSGSLLSAQVLMEFGIGGDLCDNIQQGDINLDLFENFNNFVHVTYILVVPKPLREWGLGHMGSFWRFLGFLLRAHRRRDDRSGFRSGLDGLLRHLHTCHGDPIVNSST